MPTPDLPADLDTIRRALEQADDDGGALAARLSDAQFHWQPDGGRAWSVAMCLEHLARTNAAYAASIGASAERARARRWRRTSSLSSGFAGRWFVNALEPPVTRRMRAPTMIVPATATPRAEILRQFHDSHRALLDLVTASGDLDINRATFPSPFFRFSRIRLGTGFRIVNAHDRRHLWQAGRVVEHRDFPAAPPAGRDA